MSEHGNSEHGNTEHGNTDNDKTVPPPVTPEPSSGPAQRDASGPTAHQDAPRTPRRRRGLLIAGGVVAAALLVGGGVAAGAALENDDDDDRVPAAASQERDDATDDSGDDATDDSGDDATDDSRGGSGDDAAAGSAGSGAAAYGAASADDITEVVDAASAVADGDAVEIDAKRDGTWEVKLETKAGDESEVRVRADGAAELVSTETAGADDRAPEHVLDARAVDALVQAALADTDGTVIELGSDDGSTPYDVTLLAADGTTVELDLAADFTVSARDSDD
jgi:uncharacterized membrane protein YkoI